jgi:hypothetical protein
MVCSTVTPTLRSSWGISRTVTQATHTAPSHQPGPPPGRRAAGYFVAVLLAGALIAGLIAVVSSGGGGSSTEVAGSFGTNYPGLEERRLAAGVPTMGDSSAGGAHIHPKLAIFVRGERIELPANVGIDPARSPMEMAGLHTHDASGLIHVENAADPTLGQFFEIWGVPLSPSQLGPHQAKGSESVRAWVNGSPASALGGLMMEDGQQIVVALGPKNASAPPSG